MLGSSDFLVYLCNREKFISMQTLTREDALKRFIAARDKKRECVERIEKRMKIAYQERTGKKANYTFVL